MPIRPENKHYYRGKAWRDVREAILRRAGNRCEQCGVTNHATVFRTNCWQPYQDQPGVPAFVESGLLEIQHADTGAHIGTWSGGDFVAIYAHLLENGWTKIQVVLTVSHQDHDPQNNDPANLRALCQRCHNRYDIAHRVETRRETRRAKCSERK